MNTYISVSFSRERLYRIPRPLRGMYSFRAVETAAYCPRKLYYRRNSPPEGDPPDEVRARREIAFAYDKLLADERALREAPIAVTPTTFRSQLGCAKARLGEDWNHIVSPDEREGFLSGRDCHGVAHKLFACSPPSASLIFTGKPPERGVWEPQSVRLMAVAKALSWERETAVKRVFAEYPAHGIIREVPVDGRRAAAYRKALRTVQTLDGPPARVDNRAKCSPCEYRGNCGVRTRSLRSLLGG